MGESSGPRQEGLQGTWCAPGSAGSPRRSWGGGRRGPRPGLQGGSWSIYMSFTGRSEGHSAPGSEIACLGSWPLVFAELGFLSYKE